jgi:adenosylmethionine-8-amino-7-oxononanoate aminotransferase
MSFAKGVTSGYLPLGGIMVSREIKDAMDGVKPEDRWMHAYTYSGHPTCCAVALKNIEIMERERLYDNAAKMGTRLYAGLQSEFKDHPHVGDVRGGKGLLAAVELVQDRATKANFPGDKKIGPRIQQEMTKRGVITRVRPTSGAHPANGDTIFFAPALVISESEVDRLVSVTRDAVKAALGV